MMRFLLPSIVAGLGALLIGPSVAAACSCAPPPAPEVALQAAGVVFEGTVVGIPAAPAENEPMGFGPVEYRFNVAQSWKGNPGMEVRVSTNSSGAACGRKYSKGETYIVYGTLTDEGMIKDSLCSRTRSKENAADDLAALGAGVVPHSRGGVRPGPGPGGDTPAGEPAEPTEPTGDTQSTAAQAQAASDGSSTAEAPAEGTQPAEAVDAATAEEPADAVAEAPAEPAQQPADVPAEDDKPLPRENCSLSSADASNTLGLVLLTGFIVAFRRRVGL